MDVTSYLLGKKSGGSKPPVLQDKEVTITENTTTSITADTGYDGLNEVEVITNVSSGDLNDYFEDTITMNSRSWTTLIKKIPSPITLENYNNGSFFMNSPLTTLPKVIFTSTANKTISNFFQGCSNVENFDLSGFKGHTFSSHSQLFNNCSAVKTIDLSNINLIGTSVQSMFQNCSNLETLDISTYDMSAVTNVTNMFYNASKLTDLLFGYNLGKGYSTAVSANYNNYSLKLSYCSLLTHDSLMSVINGLYDIASAGVQPQQLVLGATNLAKLSQAEIDIATNKGWTVS